MLLLDLKVKDNITLDFVHIEEASASQPNIFSNNKYEPSLNNYSRFLATFDDETLNAQGITNEALGYTFSIYKEIKDTNELIYVAKLEEGGLSITDFNVVNNTNYKYYIFKEDEESISEAVISNETETCWWDWSLVDLTPSVTEKNLYYANSNNVWKFNLNISSAEQTQKISTAVYDNLTKYPKVSVGKTNYSTGGLTCILGNIQKVGSGDLKYVEPASLADDWNKFCANGHIKLLKDRKGNAMLVSITDTSINTDDILTEQVGTVTFSWVQVDDVNGISIIGA